VAAAFDMPNEGSIANMMMRRPMVLPASAASPKSARMRASPIQLAMPIKT
jgi:hypothetical protein